MKIVGIVAEYNPFHKQHAMHIDADLAQVLRVFDRKMIRAVDHPR